MNRSSISAHLALLGANLFYGAGFTIAKTVMPRLIEPFAFILIRVGVTCALFWLFYLGGSSFRADIDKKDWKMLVLGGLFGVAVNQMLFFLGLSETLPIHASLIMMSTPLLITLFAAFGLGEKPGPTKVTGLVLGVGGAALLMLAGKSLEGDGASLRGDIFVLLNAASYAVYLVLIKPLMLRYRPLVVIRWVFLFGLLFVLPFGWVPLSRVSWAQFGINDWLAVAFIVICCTFFTYLWNVYALKRLSPATAGAYIYLQPVFAAVISTLFLHEKLTLVKVLAAALIFSGVYLVNFGWKPAFKKQS